jgi:hypothetical protein
LFYNTLLKNMQAGIERRRDLKNGAALTSRVVLGVRS